MTTMPPYNTKPPRRPAFGLIRVSSLAQVTGSDSLEAQTDQIRGYASAHGFDLQCIHEDIGSAFHRRPATAGRCHGGAARTPEAKTGS